MAERKGMTVLEAMMRPRRALGLATVAAAAVLAFVGFAHRSGQLPPGVWLLVPTAVFGAMAAAQERFARAWLMLVIAWVCGVMAYGALF